MKPLAVVLLACATAVPGDGRWSPAAPLPEPIQELSAAALHGKIYVAGGIDRSNHPTAAAFRYDPGTNGWERIADLPAPRHHMPLAVAGTRSTPSVGCRARASSPSARSGPTART